MGSFYVLVSDSNEKNLADTEHYMVNQPEAPKRNILNRNTDKYLL